MTIRLGANPIGWSNDDLVEIGGDTPLETCLAQAREAGFEGMEKGNKMPSDGDLSGWAKQGVLLLNATLTVRKGRAGSHQGKGWEKFTDAVIRAVNEKPEPVVFLLWGSYAQKKRALIDPQRHRVLEASHPSPFSAHHKSRDGKIHMFHQCGHFREVHKWLIEHNLEPVEWQKI